jgi:hypothetical protein
MLDLEKRKKGTPLSEAELAQRIAAAKARWAAYAKVGGTAGFARAPKKAAAPKGSTKILGQDFAQAMASETRRQTNAAARAYPTHISAGNSPPSGRITGGMARAVGLRASDVSGVRAVAIPRRVVTVAGLPAGMGVAGLVHSRGLVRVSSGKSTISQPPAGSFYPGKWLPGMPPQVAAALPRANFSGRAVGQSPAAVLLSKPARAGTSFAGAPHFGSNYVAHEFAHAIERGRSKKGTVASSSPQAIRAYQADIRRALKAKPSGARYWTSNPMEALAEAIPAVRGAKAVGGVRRLVNQRNELPNMMRFARKLLRKFDEDTFPAFISAALELAKFDENKVVRDESGRFTFKNAKAIVLEADRALKAGEISGRRAISIMHAAGVPGDGAARVVRAQLFRGKPERPIYVESDGKVVRDFMAENFRDDPSLRRIVPTYAAAGFFPMALAGYGLMRAGGFGHRTSIAGGAVFGAPVGAVGAVLGDISAQWGRGARTETKRDDTHLNEALRALRVRYDRIKKKRDALTKVFDESKVERDEDGRFTFKDEVVAAGSVAAAGGAVAGAREGLKAKVAADRREFRTKTRDFYGRYPERGGKVVFRGAPTLSESPVSRDYLATYVTTDRRAAAAEYAGPHGKVGAYVLSRDARIGIPKTAGEHLRPAIGEVMSNRRLKLDGTSLSGEMGRGWEYALYTPKRTLRFLGEAPKMPKISTVARVARRVLRVK